MVDISLLPPILEFFSSHCKAMKRNYSKLQVTLVKYYYIKRDSTKCLSTIDHFNGMWEDFRNGFIQPNWLHGLKTDKR